METSQKKQDDSRIEIFFQLSWEEFQRFLEKATQKLSQSLTVPGFRPGKIPQSVVEKEVGKERVLAEGAEIAVRESYYHYVIENQIEVISSPRVEVLKLAWGNPFEFKVTTEILPKISLPDYKTIASKVPKEEIEVEDKEVEETLEWLRRSRTKFFDLERPAREGDFIEIAYSSPQIENGRVFQDRFFLGKGQFVKGFERNLQGMKKGEKKQFEVVFPPDYRNKQLASKKVTFEVEIKKIQKAEVPSLNDEFARKIGRFADLSELRESIKEGILKEKEIKAKEKRREEILEAISEQIDFPLPKTLITQETNRLLENLQRDIKETFNISFKEYLQQIKKTEREIIKSLQQQAKTRIKKFLILREIGKKENIQVTEREIEEAINDFLKNYPSVEKAKKEIDLPRLKEYYKGVIFNEKVFQRLESF